MTVWTSDLEAVEVGGTIPELLKATVERYPDRTALVDGASGASVSYAELDDVVARVATGLRERGVQSGTRIAVAAPNAPSFVACLLGALRAGAVVTTINPAATEHEIGRQLADTSVDLALAVPALAPSVRSAGGKEVIVIGDGADATSLHDVVATTAAVPELEITAETLAVLLYSSGTTGMPKGVMISHGALVVAARQLAAPLEIDQHDVTLALAPFFASLGMVAELVTPLSRGATVVTQSRFDPVQFLSLLAEHRVTYTAVPPPIATRLATHPLLDTFDLSALRLLFVGGAPLRPDVQERLSERLPGCTVGQGYGMTETTGAVCLPRSREPTPLGAVGRLVPNTEVCVRDPESGIALGPNEDGELLVRGPQMMLGYLDRPQDTAALIDTDGWVHTGDLGHVDGERNVVLVDRLKELIKVNAMQVAPAEVEAALTSYPDVRDAAVTARPDDRSGEVPVAFIVAEPSIDITALERWIATRLAAYKRPAEIQVVPDLPRTPSGKLLRRQLVTTSTTGARS